MAQERLIALVRLGALGDVVRLVPLAAAAKRRWDATRLIWVAGTGVAGLLRGHPDVDELVELPRLSARSVPAWLRAASRLRRARPDVCFDLQGLAKSGLLTLASGAPRRLGLAPGRAREGSALALHAQLPSRTRSRYEEGLELLDLGWDDWQRGAEALRAAWGLGVERRGIVLHPGGSGRNRFKRWPAERYAELARLLRRACGEPILVQYGPGERELAEAVADGVPHANAVTSAELLGLVRQLGRAALFVGGDSGPLHVALLAGTPAVAVYGPSDPRTYALPPCAPHRIVASSLPCAPCRHRRCPSVECLELLSAEPVAAAALELLGTR